MNRDRKEAACTYVINAGRVYWYQGPPTPTIPVPDKSSSRKVGFSAVCVSGHLPITLFLGTYLVRVGYGIVSECAVNRPKSAARTYGATDLLLPGFISPQFRA
jgi:hypothetical protein